jgi:hypothetical protein
LLGDAKDIYLDDVPIVLADRRVPTLASSPRNKSKADRFAAQVVLKPDQTRSDAQ